MNDSRGPSTSEAANNLFPPDAGAGWTAAMGMSFVKLSSEEVVLEWEVGPQHLQPFGLVHGGVYCGAVETVASVGALVTAGPSVQVVGVENQTSFLRPVSSGTLRCTGRAIHVGRQFQLWEAQVTDHEGRIVAAGRLRVFCSPRKGP